MQQMAFIPHFSFIGTFAPEFANIAPLISDIYGASGNV
jgi:hypothetical protein